VSYPTTLGPPIVGSTRSRVSDGFHSVPLSLVGGWAVEPSRTRSPEQRTVLGSMGSSDSFSSVNTRRKALQVHNKSDGDSNASLEEFSSVDGSRLSTVGSG
jgi:hypothetical protein